MVREQLVKRACVWCQEVHHRDWCASICSAYPMVL